MSAPAPATIVVPGPFGLPGLPGEGPGAGAGARPACLRPPGRRGARLARLAPAGPRRAVVPPPGWRRGPRWPEPERGSGTVLALGAVGALVAVLAAVLLLGGVVAARHRAESAADLAALAGAVALQRGGDPCGEAARLGAANGATVRCAVDGSDVVVEAGAPTPAAARALAARAVARARAGPQP